MDSLFLRILRQWIPLAVAISVSMGMLYLVMQHDIRSEANDPQIAMAEDLAASLQRGETATVSGMIDVSESLAPFTIVYDNDGQVRASNAFLHGETPVLPDGVLTSQKGTHLPGENRLTWEPEEGVRIATVIKRYTNGYVAIGRNMREADIRSGEQIQRLFTGWVVTLLATFCSVVVVQVVLRKRY